MTETPKMNPLIQQHILEHEMRLKHVDTLLERAPSMAWPRREIAT